VTASARCSLALFGLVVFLNSVQKPVRTEGKFLLTSRLVGLDWQSARHCGNVTAADSITLGSGETVGKLEGKFVSQRFRALRGQLVPISRQLSSDALLTTPIYGISAIRIFQRDEIVLPKGFQIPRLC